LACAFLSVLQHEARRRAGDFKNRVVRDAASASGAHFPAFGSRKAGEKCKKLQTGQGSFLVPSAPVVAVVAAALGLIGSGWLVRRYG
jgi:hypothetical protein